jgi:predicted outer membrane repeat protein
LWILSSVQPAQAVFDGVVGTGSPASCTQAAFDSVLDAIQTNGGGTLTFNCGGAAAIVFSSAKSIPEIVFIDGGGLVTLSGGNSTRLFEVTATGSLTLRNIVLTNGVHPLEGGAILNQGELSLENTTIRNSLASGANSAGGAISTYGILVVNGSLFENNAAPSGGAIYVPATTNLVISDSTLRNNQANGQIGAGEGLGGAIYIETPSALTIHHTRFENNIAEVGGAIHSPVSPSTVTIDQGSLLDGNIAQTGSGGAVFSNGSVFVERSAFTNNSAVGLGGGIFNQNGSLTVSEVVFQDNSSGFTGGGIANLSSTNLVVVSTTFEGNHAAYRGGGLYSSVSTPTLNNITFVRNSAGSGGGGGMMLVSGQYDLVNVTFSANTTTTSGGGIRLDTGTVNLTNVTFYQNSAPSGGAIHRDAGTFNLKNVILEQGPQGGNCSGGVPVSLGFNLSSDSSCGLLQPGDIQSTPAKLLPLGYYGGTTKTHLPSVNSPALNNGTQSGAPLVDQRGQPRPFGLAHDIGAVERQVRDEKVYVPVIWR